MLYVRFPLSLRNVEDLLHEPGIEVRHETVRFARQGAYWAVFLEDCLGYHGRVRSM
jgi:transposase-like protein